MRFKDFLRGAVLLLAGAATFLALVTLLAAGRSDDRAAILTVALAWWALTALAGLWLGRRSGPSTQIGRLLAAARASNTLPDIDAGRIALNRLWPVGLCTVIAAGLGLLYPQIPAIAGGYALGIALAWRRQPAAVAAVENRDGVRFYLDRGSPFRGPKLVRTPGLRRVEPTLDPAARSADGGS